MPPRLSLLIAQLPRLNLFDAADTKIGVATGKHGRSEKFGLGTIKAHFRVRDYLA